jgi:hypothetical protein
VSFELPTDLDFEAVQIIANAISEMGHPSLKRQDIVGYAIAILSRLAHANIIIQRYDAEKETSDGAARIEELFGLRDRLLAFQAWLQKRYVSYVFDYNSSGLVFHKALVDETKEVLEKLEAVNHGE